MMKKLLTTILTASTLFFASSTFATEKEHYVVGTEAGYAPFEYLNEKGEIVGFDKDILDYICNKINATCELKNQAFDALIPNVIFKKIDFAIAGINVTADRAKKVAFSEEYLPTKGWVFLVANNSDLKDPKELNTAAYQNATPGVNYLKEETNITPKAYDTFELALLDMKAGRVDAVFVNEEVGFNFAKDPEVKVLGDVIHSPIFGEGIAIVLNKRNKELKAKLDAAILEAKENGTIDQLKAKYGL